MLNVVETITKKYPECKIILSSILPRMDNRHNRINEINKKIKEECSKKPNVYFVAHNDIFPSYHHLYDKKHLNEIGVRVFAKNLKTAYFYAKNGTKRAPETRQTHTQESNRGHMSTPSNSNHKLNIHFRPCEHKAHSNGLSSPGFTPTGFIPPLAFIPPPNHMQPHSSTSPPRNIPPGFIPHPALFPPPIFQHPSHIPPGSIPPPGPIPPLAVYLLLPSHLLH